MIGVAILGAGIGAQHLDGYRALPGAFEVRWIIDLDTTRAEALNSGARVSEQIDDALRDSEVEMVDICLPPHLHAPVALQALAAEKDVICEKPLATSLADIDVLRSAQAETGKHIYPVFQYRFGPALDALDALRSAGLTGRPLVAALETHWARGPDYYAIPWRGTWEGEQGGAVLGHAIHAHDLLATYFAPITAVSGAIATRANPIETEDCAALTFELAGGALASSSITLGAATDETRLRFTYEHLTATSGTNPYAPGADRWTFTARDPAQQAEIDACIAAIPPAPTGFTGLLAEIAKAQRSAPNRAVTFDDGAASIELVTAIYAAARSGTRQTLPLPSEHPMRKGWRP